MEVNNKVVIVTGGGNGMGREMVLNLLHKGAKVAAVDMREAALIETFKLAGDKSPNLTTHILDITDKEAIAKFEDEIVTFYGSIDGLINNAGIIQPFVKVNDLKFNDIEKVMNVNFYGTLFMIKAFLPHLLKRPEAYIVNISSMGGFLPVPGQSVYGASKAAVKLLTEGLYAELLSTNVKVAIVFPGAIGTNISVNSGVEVPKMPEGNSPKIKILSAIEAAEIIISGIQKNQVRMFVGKDSKFMDLLYRFNPIYATKLIGKKMKSLLPN